MVLQPADGLSRREGQSELSQITILQPAWVLELIESYVGDEMAQQGIAECTLEPQGVSFYYYSDGILRYKGKLYVGQNSGLREKLIKNMHESNMRGHSGIENT